MNDNRNLTTRGSTTVFQLCIVWKVTACRENKEGDVAIKSADQAGSIEEWVDPVGVARFKQGFHQRRKLKRKDKKNLLFLLP